MFSFINSLMFTLPASFLKNNSLDFYNMLDVEFLMLSLGSFFSP